MAARMKPKRTVRSLLLQQQQQPRLQQVLMMIPYFSPLHFFPFWNEVRTCTTPWRPAAKKLSLFPLKSRTKEEPQLQWQPKRESQREGDEEREREKALYIICSLDIIYSAQWHSIFSRWLKIVLRLNFVSRLGFDSTSSVPGRCLGLSHWYLRVDAQCHGNES